MSGGIPVCSTLWKLPLGSRLKSHRVQTVFEVWVRVGTCFRCQSLSASAYARSLMTKEDYLLMLKWVCVKHHLVLSWEAGHSSVTRTVSWERYGGGNEETSYWTFTVIPWRGSNGNSPFLLWTMCMLCLVPLSPVPHFCIKWHQRKAVALLD